MEDVLSGVLTDEQRLEQDRRISEDIGEVIRRERRRLLNFIRKRVGDESDAEDILQDVFYELVEAYRLLKPVEQIGAWLYRVARNRIIDRFRKKRFEPVASLVTGGDHQDFLLLEELLPSSDAGPEAAYVRSVLLEELDAAIEELPEEQRNVFVAHEIDGRSFKELAEETGLKVNTLLSRKRYAILHLRKRLRAIYREFSSE